MSGLTPEEERKKKAVFDAMSARSRKRILDRGYENWDPYLKPKDPIDIRMAGHRQTALMLMREFLHACPGDERSNAYRQGAWELCMGIAAGEERWKGAYDFSCWHRDHMNKGGL